MKAILSVAALLAGVTSASADCRPAPTPAYGGVKYFLGIEPSDGPLDVWCRLQQLRGDYRVNVFFPEEQSHRTMNVSFVGKPTRPKAEFAAFIQSLLPTTDVKARDEGGMTFKKVLEKSVQAQSPFAPDGQNLGLPPGTPISREIAIWTPVMIRVAPIKVGGVDFAFEARFKPSAGRFMMALAGHAEDVVFKGYRGAILRGSGLSGANVCTTAIPDCKDLGELIDLHTAWNVDFVRIYASGSGLSAAAATIFPTFAADNAKFVSSSNWASFKATTGEAAIELDDGVREAKAKSEGDRSGSLGANRISLAWREKPNARATYKRWLEAYALQVREAYAMQREAVTKQAPKPSPPVAPAD